MSELHEGLNALYHRDRPGRDDCDPREIAILRQDAETANEQGDVGHLYQDPPYRDAILSADFQAKYTTAKEESRDSKQRSDAEDHNIEPGQPEEPTARLELRRDLISGSHDMSPL